MPLRVIAGLARGRAIKGPPSDLTRPTSDKVRGAIFSTVESLLAVLANLDSDESSEDASWSGEPSSAEENRRDDEEGKESEPETNEFVSGVWEGLRVLDLYAGTGALGIEALSRGAAWADFVDSAKPCARVIHDNLKTLKLDGRARVISTRVENALAHPEDYRLGGSYSVCFLDPPYGDQTLARSLEKLAEGGLLAENALVIVETSRRFELGVQSERLFSLRQKRHGDTVYHVLIYRS